MLLNQLPLLELRMEKKAQEKVCWRPKSYSIHWEKNSKFDNAPCQ